MTENLINSIYSTSTPNYSGLNFNNDAIITACNECYADRMLGNKVLTNDCFICANFLPKNEVKEVPIFDFLAITLALAVGLYCFKIFFVDIWMD